MLIGYVILYGYDLGTRIRPFCRRPVRARARAGACLDRSILGRERGLVAAGGTLFLTFPVLYASSFSSFYLPLMIVL
jgi:cytochrome d ubiquinol oxidase subunit II